MISFAIIGWGHIARKHKEAIDVVEGARLVAVSDLNPERLKELAPFPEIKKFTDLNVMLAEALEVDVVCICTPSGLHAAHAIAAIRAGKHVIIEKPVALSLHDAEAIREAASLYGTKVAVVHPNRFRPAIRKLKLALDQGLFGKLSHVNATVRWNRAQAYYDQASWRGTKEMDGGVLLNQAVHSLDLLEWLVGPVTGVKSMVDTRIRKMEAEDTALAVLRFDTGVLGVVEATTAIYDKNLEETISIFGEHGYAVIGGPTANWFKQLRSSYLSESECEAWIQEIESDPYGEPGHRSIIRDMVAAVCDNREPIVPLHDGIRAMKLALDISSNGTSPALIANGGDFYAVKDAATIRGV